jgi:hypothetical protein
MLTYMATTEQLIGDGVLTRLDIPLDGVDRPWRCILATKGFMVWLTESLPTLEGNWGDLDPTQQLDAIFADFVAGEPLEFRKHIRVIQPWQNGVWEIRTTDLRVFGWFVAKNGFICSSAGLKHQIERHGLYPKHRKRAEAARDRLNLNNPKCVYGVAYDDILSDAPQR